jgi:hypothetical protein
MVMDSTARDGQARIHRGGSPRRRRVSTALVAGALVVASLAIPLAAATPAGAQRRPVSTNTALSGRGSKLTPRLQALVRPEVAALSAGARSQAVGLSTTGAGSLLTRPDGRVVVRMRLTDLSSATTEAIKAAGVSDLSVSVPDALANGALDPAALPALVAVPGVASVSEEITPMLAAADRATSASAPASTNVLGGCPTGIVTEGDTQLKADQARTNFSVNGAGVRVGVLSDSFNAQNGLTADITGNELPGIANSCGFNTPVTIQAEGSGGDEGRAMAQIVHDLAPGSPLSFATAFNGEADMAKQIRDLRTNGASVIVDDVTYFDEPMFQDGTIASAVDDVVAAGATYYSSAANNALPVGPGGADVSSYETGAFRSTACPAAVNSFEGAVSQCHNFAQGGTDNGDTVTIGANQRAIFALSYSQPQGGVTTDLDLLLVDANTGAVLSASANTNIGVSGTQTPSEVVGYQNGPSPLTARLVVARYQAGGGDAATPRFKWVTFTNGNTGAVTSVQYTSTSGNDIVGPSVIGHNGAARAASVAAVPYNDSGNVEYYSSKGPVRQCWLPSTGTWDETTASSPARPAPPSAPARARPSASPPPTAGPTASSAAALPTASTGRRPRRPTPRRWPPWPARSTRAASPTRSSPPSSPPPYPSGPIP